MDLEDLRQVVRPADPQQIASGAERRAKRSGAVRGKCPHVGGECLGRRGRQRSLHHWTQLDLVAAPG